MFRTCGYLFALSCSLALGAHRHTGRGGADRPHQHLRPLAEPGRRRQRHRRGDRCHHLGRRRSRPTAGICSRPAPTSSMPRSGCRCCSAPSRTSTRRSRCPPSPAWISISASIPTACPRRRAASSTFAHNETPNLTGTSPADDDIVTITAPIVNLPITVGTDVYFFNLLGFSVDGGVDDRERVQLGRGRHQLGAPLRPADDRAGPGTGQPAALRRRVDGHRGAHAPLAPRREPRLALVRIPGGLPGVLHRRG